MQLKWSPSSWCLLGGPWAAEDNGKHLDYTHSWYSSASGTIYFIKDIFQFKDNCQHHECQSCIFFFFYCDKDQQYQHVPSIFCIAGVVKHNALFFWTQFVLLQCPCLLPGQATKHNIWLQHVLALTHTLQN